MTREVPIPESEIEITYIRSSGPGGQNVNKVNSKARLRWNLLESASLSSEQKLLVLGKLGSRISREGDLLITSERFRDQLRNRGDCLEKFRDLLARALVRPKKRKKTKPSHSSRKKARERKSRHSEKKQLRRWRGNE